MSHFYLKQLYTPETGFLYSCRIITASVARNPVSLYYIYMEYAVLTNIAGSIKNFQIGKNSLWC